MSAARWVPALILTVGLGLVASARAPESPDLRAPLTSIPTVLGGLQGREMALDEEVRAAVGVDRYLLRAYARPGSRAASASVYVGYHASQARGRTIHSPRNCLPGSGWESVSAGQVRLATADGPVTVNRHVLQQRRMRAVVLYWYQGRGRVESGEYRVKWDLLRDAALTRRTEEALVRVVVPVRDDEARAYALAASLAAELVPALDATLPT